MSFSYRTNARVNLLGNPSDIYYGIVVSSTMAGLEVEGKIKESDLSDYSINGTRDEGFNILVSNIVMFLKKQEFTINPFIYQVSSNIPKQGGLAGSTAIIVNLISCLNQLYQLGLGKTVIAHYAMVIEHEVIGITAGPSDRFIITFGGAKYMDYTTRDYRTYLIEDLDLAGLSLWVGIRAKNISSGDIHKYPYNAYPVNVELQDVISNLIKCAIKGKKAIEEGDVQLLGKIMNENQQLTNQYGTFGNPNTDVILQRKVDKEILEFCTDNDVMGAKLVGSSGSIVILSEEKPEFLFNFKPSQKLEEHFSQELLGPQISDIVKLEPK